MGNIKNHFKSTYNKKFYGYIIGLLPIIPLFNYVLKIYIPWEDILNFGVIISITLISYGTIIIISVNDYFDGCFSFKKLLLTLGLILLIGYVFLFRIEVPLNYVDNMSQFNCDKNSKNILKEVVKDNQINYYDYLRAAHAERSCICRKKEVEDREKELLEKKKKIDFIKKIQNK